jgi:hypothetical protein
MTPSLLATEPRNGHLPAKGYVWHLCKHYPYTCAGVGEPVETCQTCPRKLAAIVKGCKQ